MWDSILDFLLHMFFAVGLPLLVYLLIIVLDKYTRYFNPDKA